MGINYIRNTEPNHGCFVFRLGGCGIFGCDLPDELEERLFHESKVGAVPLILG